MIYTVDAHPVGGNYPKVGWGEDSFSTPPVIDEPNDGLPTTDGPKAGVPVHGGVLPKDVRWDELADNPPLNFDNMPTLNVSERAKEVIESVEPGVPQFYPSSTLTATTSRWGRGIGSTSAIEGTPFIRPRAVCCSAKEVFTFHHWTLFDARLKCRRMSTRALPRIM